jgi:hypothetical protein
VHASPQSQHLHSSHEHSTQVQQLQLAAGFDASEVLSPMYPPVSRTVAIAVPATNRLMRDITVSLRGTTSDHAAKRRV